jgi:phosphomannomutase
MTVDPGIFKAYDVRGLYPDQIDEDLAYRIGRAFARVLGELERNRGSWTRARTCSTSGWSGPRCSITRSARASSTAA